MTIAVVRPAVGETDYARGVAVVRGGENTAAALAAASRAEAAEANVNDDAVAAASALSAMSALLADQQALSQIDWFVDPVNGNDANAGTTDDAAFATIAAARNAAAAGDVIGLARGQTHFLTAADNAGDLLFQLCEQSLIGFGASSRPAVVSAGQSLAGKTFTVHSGDVWKTTIDLLDAHIPNGTSSANTTYPFVRLGESYYQWAVGGADIAANLAALASMEGGFAINVTGETDEDIRDSASGRTAFDLYVRMPGGADPNGQDLITLFAQSAYKFRCDFLQDLELRDAWGKDTTGSVIETGNAPRLRRIRSIGAGAHGWVGPCDPWSYYAKSHPREGMSNFAQGISQGGGINLFSAADQPGHIMRARGIETDGFLQHIYGHVSSNDVMAQRLEFYPSVDPGWADNRARNCGTGLQIDPSSTPPIVPDGVVFFTEIDWEPNDFFFTGAEDVVFAKAGTVPFQNASATRQIIYNANGGRGSLDIGAITFSSLEVNGISFNKLLARITGTVTTPPTLTLRGTTLPQGGDEEHFYCSNTAATCNFDLVLTEGAETGDLIEDGRTFYPNDVTIERGCTFAFADQTSRANVRTLLDGAGSTHSIDNNTTLLRRDGAVAEGPA